MVLSHGDWDHAGGLLTAIEAITKSRAPNGLDCFVHPSMFAERALQRPNGDFLMFEPVPEPEALANAGANVIHTREPQALGGGAFYLSGEIPRVTRCETGFPGHMRRSPDGQLWEPNPRSSTSDSLRCRYKRQGIPHAFSIDRYSSTGSESSIRDCISP